MIRNFLYLDSDKLRSVSSQLFEGVTERVILNNSTGEEKNSEQKGPLNSGRLLGDIFSQERSTSELKFLEDHAYSLFEAKLEKSDLIDVVGDETDFSRSSKSFIKVTGKLSINDVAATAALLKDFNQLGEAQWRVTNEDGSSLTPIADSMARKKAAELGLQMNKKFTDSFSSFVDIRIPWSS